MYRAKRLFDFTLATVLLVVLIPVVVACALAVWWGDGRPILFAQTRAGRWGQSFRIFKFRTMRQGVGAAVTVFGDARITPLGRRLRHAKLDEIPQLWNVWIGDMSLVGPRPEVPQYVAAEARNFRAIARLRPGITDFASVIFRDEEQVLATHAAHAGFYERVLLPRKLALARLYGRYASVRLDLALLVATVCIALGNDSPVQRIVGRKLYAHARTLKIVSHER